MKSIQAPNSVVLYEIKKLSAFRHAIGHNIMNILALNVWTSLTILSAFSRNTSNQSFHFMIVSELHQPFSWIFFLLFSNLDLFDFVLFVDVFDVIRDAKDRVFLLDFSPFNEKYTESLAFEWSELTAEDEVSFHISNHQKIYSNKMKN